MPDNIEDNNVQISERYRLPHRYQKFAPAIALLALFVSVAIVAGIVAAFYFMRVYFSWVILAWMVAIGSLPIIGIGFAIAALVKYIRSPKIIPLDTTATMLYHSEKNVQVFSTNSVNAFETQDARLPQAVITQEAESRNPWTELYNNQDEKYRTTIPYYSGNGGGNRPETALEAETDAETRQALPIEAVMQTLEYEAKAASDLLDDKKRDVVKGRIQQFHRMHVPMRQIAKIVGMEGRKYKQFKELCEELEIGEETN